MATEDRFLIRIAQACSVRDVIYALGIPGLREIRARNIRANAGRSCYALGAGGQILSALLGPFGA